MAFKRLIITTSLILCGTLSAGAATLDQQRNEAANLLIQTKLKAQKKVHQRTDLSGSDKVQLVVFLEDSVTELLQVNMAKECFEETYIDKTVKKANLAEQNVRCHIRKIQNLIKKITPLTLD